jgi:hypothetical protein
MQSSPKPNIVGAVFGLLFAAIGLPFVLMATGILPSPGANAPLWVLGATGAAFVFAGASVTLSALAGSTARDGSLPASAPFALQLLQVLLGLSIIATLALTGTWAALGAGGGFRSSASVAGATLSGRPNETLARVVFGFGALTTWAIFAVFAVRGWRKLRAAMQE